MKSTFGRPRATRTTISAQTYAKYDFEGVSETPSEATKKWSRKALANARAKRFLDFEATRRCRREKKAKKKNRILTLGENAIFQFWVLSRGLISCIFGPAELMKIGIIEKQYFFDDAEKVD